MPRGPPTTVSPSSSFATDVGTMALSSWVLQHHSHPTTTTFIDIITIIIIINAIIIPSMATKVAHQQLSCCLRLSIWCDDQATLARQRNGIFSRSLCCCQAGRDGLSQPNRIHRGGLFAQLKGSLTKKRHRYCTVFVDHNSGLHFMHLQIDDSAAKTIFAKQAFEMVAAKQGVRILH